MGVYKRYIVQQKYVNGVPTEDYRVGGEKDEKVYPSLSTCNLGCDNIETQWINVEGEFICDGTTKYEKWRKQQKCDTATEWVDVYPYEYQKGHLIEDLSDDCGFECTEYEYRWVDDGNNYICEDTTKYQQQIKQERCIEKGELWVNTSPSEYQKGSIIETLAEDCGYCEYEYQWSKVGYMCSGISYYEKLQRQKRCLNTSIWDYVYPSVYKIGDMVSSFSYDCDPIGAVEEAMRIGSDFVIYSPYESHSTDGGGVWYSYLGNTFVSSTLIKESTSNPIYAYLMSVENVDADILQKYYTGDLSVLYVPNCKILNLSFTFPLNVYLGSQSFVKIFDSYTNRVNIYVPTSMYCDYIDFYPDTSSWIKPYDSVPTPFTYFDAFFSDGTSRTIKTLYKIDATTIPTSAISISAIVDSNAVIHIGSDLPNLQMASFIDAEQCTFFYPYMSLAYFRNKVPNPYSGVSLFGKASYSEEDGKFIYPNMFSICVSSDDYVSYSGVVYNKAAGRWRSLSEIYSLYTPSEPNISSEIIVDCEDYPNTRLLLVDWWGSSSIYNYHGHILDPSSLPNYSYITSITDLDGGIWSLGSGFSEYNKLSYVNLSNCQYLCRSAFYDCDYLTSVYLPKVDELPFGAFRYCSRLSDIQLDKVQFVDSHAFVSLPSLSELHLPCLEVIKGEAFYQFRNSISVYFDGSVMATLSGLTGCGLFGDTSSSLPKVYVPKSLYSQYRGSYGYSVGGWEYYTFNRSTKSRRYDFGSILYSF